MPLWGMKKPSRRPSKSQKPVKPKRKPSSEPAEAAYNLIQTLIRKAEAKGQPHPIMQAMGRMGGQKGGLQRWRAQQTPERLAEIGKAGAAKRWGHS